jgi:hypothetical protein
MNEGPNGYHNGNGNGNGNGHANGNGKDDGVFSITRKEDPVWTKIAPAARREVMKNLTLSLGARMFYCWLIDCSLWTGVHMRPGVYRVANSYLALLLGVSERTIQNWKSELVGAGYVWLTEKRMKNSFPMTVYNVVAIIGQAMLPLNLETEDGSLPEHEHLSNCKRPSRLVRDQKGKWVRGSKSAEMPKSQETAQISAVQDVASKNLPSSHETIFRPPAQPIAAHDGNQLRASAETDCVGGRQPVAAVGGNNLRAWTETDCVGGRQKPADKRESLYRVKSIEKKGGKATPPPKSDDQAFRDWVRRLDDMLNSDLKRLRQICRDQLKDPKLSDAGRELLKRKLVELALRLDGPQPEMADHPKKNPVRAIKPAEPTEEELWDGAVQAVAMGKEHLLNDRQRQMLKQRRVS